MNILISYIEICNNKKYYDFINSKYSNVNKIYVYIDDKDYSSMTVKDQYKFVKKYKDKLNSIGIKCHDIILKTEDSLTDVTSRNHIDVYIGEEIIENEFVELNTSFNDNNFIEKLDNYIQDSNEYIKKEKIVGIPSIDKVWEEKITKKQMRDYEKFSKEDNLTIYDEIRLRNKDFLYKTAITYYGCTYTYEEFCNEVEKYATAYQKNGVKYDDKIMICSPNVPSTIFAFYAAILIGAIPSPLHIYEKSEAIHEYLKKEDTKYIVSIGVDDTIENIANAIEDTNVEKVIVVPLDYDIKIQNIESFITKFGIKMMTSRFIKEIKKLKNFSLKRVNKDEAKKMGIKNLKVCENKKNFYKKMVLLKDFLHGCDKKKYIQANNPIAAIMHTGGTTGTGKSTMLTQENFKTSNGSFEAHITDFVKGDKIIAIPPMFHVLGLNNCVNLVLRNTGNVILIAKYDKNNLGKLFKKYQPELFFSVPKIGKDMLKNKEDYDEKSFENLKYIPFGGEESSTEFIESMSKFLKDNGAKIDVSQSLGATEGTCSFTNTFNNCNVRGSVGIPIIGVDMKIIEIENPNFKELGYYKTGEICFSGPIVMKEYLDDKANTEAVLKIHDDGKLWFHTGDCGYIDHEGNLFFKNRIKDMVKINGEQVFPSTIKNVICRHPDVDDCAVFCVEKDDRKIIVANVIANSPNVNLDDLRKEVINLCKTNLKKESIPTIIEIKEKLAETKFYKIDNNAMKSEYEKVLNLKKI